MRCAKKANARCHLVMPPTALVVWMSSSGAARILLRSCLLVLAGSNHPGLACVLCVSGKETTLDHIDRLQTCAELHVDLPMQGHALTSVPSEHMKRGRERTGDQVVERCSEMLALVRWAHHVQR